MKFLYHIKSRLSGDADKIIFTLVPTSEMQKEIFAIVSREGVWHGDHLYQSINILKESDLNIDCFTETKKEYLFLVEGEYEEIGDKVKKLPFKVENATKKEKI